MRCQSISLERLLSFYWLIAICYEVVHLLAHSWGNFRCSIYHFASHFINWEQKCLRKTMRIEWLMSHLNQSIIERTSDGIASKLRSNYVWENKSESRLVSHAIFSSLKRKASQIVVDSNPDTPSDYYWLSSEMLVSHNNWMGRPCRLNLSGDFYYLHK